MIRVHRPPPAQRVSTIDAEHSAVQKPVLAPSVRHCKRPSHVTASLHAMTPGPASQLHDAPKGPPEHSGSHVQPVLQTLVVSHVHPALQSLVCQAQPLPQEPVAGPVAEPDAHAPALPQNPQPDCAVQSPQVPYIAHGSEAPQSRSQVHPVWHPPPVSQAHEVLVQLTTAVQVAATLAHARCEAVAPSHIAVHVGRSVIPAQTERTCVQIVAQLGGGGGGGVPPPRREGPQPLDTTAPTTSRETRERRAA